MTKRPVATYTAQAMQKELESSSRRIMHEEDMQQQTAGDVDDDASSMASRIVCDPPPPRAPTRGPAYVMGFTVALAAAGFALMNLLKIR